MTLFFGFFCIEHFVLGSWPGCENAIFIFKHGRIVWWHLFYLLPRTCPLRHVRFTWSTFSSSTFPFSFSLLGKVEAEIVMIPASFSLYWGGRDSFLLLQLERKVCLMVSWPRLLVSLPASCLFLKLDSHLSPLGWCDCKSSPERVEGCVLWAGRGQKPHCFVVWWCWCPSSFSELDKRWRKSIDGETARTWSHPSHPLSYPC